MNIRTETRNGVRIALVESGEPLMSDVQSALDLMATVRYETDADCIALNKEALDERFFVLSSRLAGDILQKFVNYHMKLAVYGDFSGYTSKPLKDFFYESNNGSHAFFVSSAEEAAEKLARA
jgi:hypothetical protein